MENTKRPPDTLKALFEASFARFRSRQPAHQVGAADDADQPPCLQHRNTLDPVLLQKARNFAQRG
jgi:hypothetical protein